MDANEKLAIHELLGRASYALDQRAIDQLEACFAADAVLVLSVDGVEGEPRFEGRDAIRSVDFVDSLPKAPTGKILKRILREPCWTARDKRV